MKSNNLLLLVLSVILLLIVGCVQPDQIDSNKASNDKTSDDKPNEQIDKNFLLHEDIAYKVKILYPKAWKLVETKDNIFAFQEPKFSADDKVQENINLIMNDVSGQNLKFDKFKDLAMENLKQTVQDFSLIESSSTTLAGAPAQKTVFTAFAPKLKLLQVITLKDDITYAITFVSEPESFESYLSTVQKMLDSFEITGDIKEQDKKEPVNKEPEKSEVKKQDSLVGTYRCWSYNVQGAGKSCTSPPLILKEDGTYTMSSEQGKYTVNGDTILLSESKLRGPGKLLEDGNQIRFEYDYNNWHHIVTYLKTNWDNAEETNNLNTSAGAKGTKYVEVSLNVVFPESQGVSGINSAALVVKGEKELTGEAIAYESKPHTVTALFRKLSAKPGIPTGKIYTVQVSSGFGYWEVGEIDLRDVKEDVELTLNAKYDTGSTSTSDTSSSNTDNIQQPSQPASEQQTTIPASTEQPPQTDTQQTQPSANAPKCDPNIPKYSQPGCVE